MSSSPIREDTKSIIKFVLNMLGESGRVNYGVGHYDVFEEMDKRLSDFDLELVWTKILSTETAKKPRRIDYGHS